MGNHRASSRDRRQTRAVPPTGTTGTTGGAPGGGRRRATRSQRPGILAKIPAIPTVVGIAALAVAGYGAVTVSHDDDLGNGSIALSSGSANGTDAGLVGDIDGADAVFFGPGGDARAQAISRDSDRQAQQDAAQQQLQAKAEAQSEQRNAALTNLAKAAEKRAGEIAKNLWVLPTVGYHLTARFGMSSGLWAHNHTGLDFAAPEGSPVFAIADGVITETGYDGAYGNKTVETLADGTEIWYAHQEAFKVEVGDKVHQSQDIGVLGSTGNTTGPHVHIEVRPGGGDPVDPFPAFVFHGVTP